MTMYVSLHRKARNAGDGKIKRESDKVATITTSQNIDATKISSRAILQVQAETEKT